MKFSEEVHHGGVSCGVGFGRTYVVDNWNSLMIWMLIFCLMA
jgi:hypothetical protein